MSKKDLKISRLTLFSLLFFASSVLILIFSRLNKEFANFFNERISYVFRWTFAKISGVFPFSIAELLIFLFPIIITVLIIATVKNKNITISNYLTHIISFFLIFFSIYVFTFGVGYHTEDFYDRFEIKKVGASAPDLKSTAELLVSALNSTNDYINYDNDGFSVMPYDVSTLNEKLNDEYKSLCDKYDFIDTTDGKIKPVLTSEALSRAHITGVYSFFTGEVNINAHFPDCVLPFTAAHELAHQRGIAREDEANITAFLACINSKDEYLKYSALMNASLYVTSALLMVDQEAFTEIYGNLDKQIKRELRAYADFYEKYENSTAGKIGAKIGHAHLILNGEGEGIKTYDLMVDLLVAYFRDEIK